jgi:hypothetical protein
MWIAPERRSVSRWAVPGLALVAGVVIAAMLVADDRVGTGLVALGVLAGYALLLGYRRHEPALPGGEGFGTGHRARAHAKAAAMTGDVLTGAVVAAVIVQGLRGADIVPYAWLAALAGVTYALTATFSNRAL